ncbi:MAG: IS4 family transposase [Labilithrix sp.]|nr:IS4 family transposase [Labilithrix sp.]
MFDRAREREGAYDFLESPHVRPEALAASVFNATVARAQGSGCVYVVVDGSALSLTDENGAKGFGPVGSPNREVSGLKVMNALAVARDGVPLGLVDQIFWNRPATETMTRAERVKRNAARPFEDKETSYFVEAAKSAIARLGAECIDAWVIIDREADDRNILLGLHEAGCRFTIRGRWNRRLWPSSEPSLHALLEAEPSLGQHTIEIGRTGRRAARTAVVDVRAAQVILRFPARGPAYPRQEGLRLFAVRVREVGVTDGLDWLLYTNVPVISAEHAHAIVESYQVRWRIEEFHRTWKQGECNVEDAQLRSEPALIKWATLMSAVAMRIERLKYLSRKKPDAPASSEFALEEIEALKLDQRRRMKPKRTRLPEMPSMREATRWAAELGGWTGERNGPPGSITLARGLERLGYLVEGIALARSTPAGSTPRAISRRT